MRENQDHNWYVLNNGKITGPFPLKLISSYLILGRVRLDTKISTDQQNWQPISRYPALIPEEVKHQDDPGGRLRLERARIREDERRSMNRRDGETEEQANHPNRRNKNERRKNDDANLQVYRKMREDIQANRVNMTKYSRVGAVVLIVIVLLTLSFFLVLEPAQDIQKVDCNAQPIAGIDWSDCNKVGAELLAADLRKSILKATRLSNALLSKAWLAEADLSYADLSGADLLQADLTQAKLVGANLNNANLLETNLSGADLSYADLTQAHFQNTVINNTRFDHAIWIDGSRCISGSIGRCLQ